MFLQLMKSSPEYNHLQLYVLAWANEMK